ncbi:MAG TPA: PAS domain S-box protein [Candidatus Binatia bacterium]|nr:PAS domain S-box protein [Candidatus Binatia bacterium]
MQLFRDVFDASPIGIVVENVEGQLLFVNPSFCSMLGFSEEELRRKHCVDFSPAEDAEKDWALFQQLRSGAIDHYQLEKRYFRRDGSLMWGRLSISLLNNGASPLVLAMVEEISEKKAALDREHDLLETLDLVTKQMTAAVSRCSRDLRYLWANQAYMDWIQRPWDELVNRPIAEIVGTSAFESLQPYFQQVLAGKDVHYEAETDFQGIGRRWTSATYRPTFDVNGAVEGWVAVVLDITARKRAEEALRESEEKFRSIFREAGVGMVIVSPEGRYLGANTTFCECLGYTEEELREKTVESITLAEDWPAFSRKLQELLSGESGFQWFSKRCLHKSGRIVHTESSAALIRSSDGTPRYFVGEVLDITSRIQAEAALSDMTRKLIEAQETERARIGRELHDDINQRLAMLAVDLEQLQENPYEIEGRVQELRRQMLEISNDVQALSHDLHSSKLEYLGVAAGIRSWCREFAERQRMEIDFKSSVQSVLPIEIGRTLFRVLQEAVHNASKYSGVKRVEVRLEEQSGEIHLIISDLGKGFEVGRALQNKGLGLTSMQERVRLLNGTILIESKPMGGTRIHVRVPNESEQRLRLAAG